MAEKNMPTFAVDADITPLQGRYFQAAQSRLSDPRLREQAYGLIKQTFGGIQQARDLQRARQQEDEDRSLNMDVRRAQLEQGKLELGLAREKFRKQQESTATGASIYSAFDGITKDPSRSPQEKASEIYRIAAENSDFFTDNPAATNRLNFTLGIIAPPKMGTTTNSAKQASVIVTLINNGATPQTLRDMGIDPDSPIAKDLFKKKEEEKIAKRGALAKDAIKPYESAIDELKTGGSAQDWPEVDQSLRILNDLNLVDEPTKKELTSLGVGVFDPKGSEYTAKSSDQAAAARKKIWSIIQQTVYKAGKPVAAPQAPAPSGFDTGMATQ